MAKKKIMRAARKPVAKPSVAKHLAKPSKVKAAKAAPAVKTAKTSLAVRGLKPGTPPSESGKKAPVLRNIRMQTEAVMSRNEAVQTALAGLQRQLRKRSTGASRPGANSAKKRSRTDAAGNDADLDAVLARLAADYKRVLGTRDV